MRDRKKGVKSVILSAMFLLLLIVVTYYLLFKRFDIKEILAIIGDADMLYIAIGFAMIFIYLACYCFFTKTLLASRGYFIGIYRGFVYAAADFYFSAVTPSATGGQPFVIYYMNKDGVPVSEGFLSTFLHTTVYKIVLLTLNLFSVVIFWNVWSDSGWAFIALWFLGLVITLGIILLTLLSVLKRDAVFRFGNAIIKFLGNFNIIKDTVKVSEKFAETVDDYQLAAKELKGKRKLLFKLFVIVFIQRLAYFSVAFIIYCSLGNTGYGYFYFLAIQAFIALAIDSLPLPGGMGANELAIIMMYKATFGPERAAGAMLLIRFVNYYFGLILSSAVTISYHIYKSFKSKKVVK
ncbi:MAG: lysylphosphatidylglycerol synthase transmembrane domain-containing protein [Eubacteriales bacterium]|nr:lysylphosphatidylglycerol synthase transmembrane domain-containing protein [Eubacteriales bacterium]